MKIVYNLEEGLVLWKTKGNVAVWSLSSIWLFCDPMDCSQPRSSVHGVFQAGILEQVAISFFRASSRPRD